jgi:hypothetical protein
MSDAADLLAQSTQPAPKGSPWEGKQLILPAVDMRGELFLQARFESIVALRLEARRHMIGEARYKAELKEQSDKSDANEYAFATDLFFRWLVSKEGRFEYCLVKMQRGTHLPGSELTPAQLTVEQFRQWQAKDETAWFQFTESILDRDFRKKGVSQQTETPVPTTTESE